MSHEHENLSAVYLFCRAYLHNSRNALHTPSAVFIDALVIPSLPIAGMPLTACLYYTKKNAEDEIQPGIYDIYAKVLPYSASFGYRTSSTFRFHRLRARTLAYISSPNASATYYLDLLSRYVLPVPPLVASDAEAGPEGLHP